MVIVKAALLYLSVRDMYKLSQAYEYTVFLLQKPVNKACIGRPCDLVSEWDQDQEQDCCLFHQVEKSHSPASCLITCEATITS